MSHTIVIVAGSIITGALGGMLLPRASLGDVPSILNARRNPAGFSGMFIGAFFEIESAIALALARVSPPRHEMRRGFTHPRTRSEPCYVCDARC